MYLDRKEKLKLGGFVNTPWRNYNKSKELLNNHEYKEYQKYCIEQASDTRPQYINVDRRIDVQINRIAAQNSQKNSAILPHIVDTVLLSRKQQIVLCGHWDDDMNFCEPATRNEGSFIALI